MVNHFIAPVLRQGDPCAWVPPKFLSDTIAYNQPIVRRLPEGEALAQMGVNSRMPADQVEHIVMHRCREIGSGCFKRVYRAQFERYHFDHGPLLPMSDAHLKPVRASYQREERAIAVTHKEAKLMDIVVEAALDNPEDPFAPKIYGVYSSGRTRIVEMELLQPVPRDENKLASAEYRWVHNGHRPSDELLARSPYMRQIEDSLYRGNAAWDMHSGNFMLRGDQVVVTDPIYA